MIVGLKKLELHRKWKNKIGDKLLRSVALWLCCRIKWWKDQVVTEHSDGLLLLQVQLTTKAIKSWRAQGERAMQSCCL